MPALAEVEQPFDVLLRAKDAAVFGGPGPDRVAAGIVTSANRVALGIVDLDEQKRRLLSTRFDPALYCVHDALPPVPDRG